MSQPRTVKGVSSKLNVSEKTVRVWAEQGILNRMGLVAESIAAVRKELGITDQQPAVQTSETYTEEFIPSQPCEDIADDDAFHQRVAGGKHLTRAERLAIMRAGWNKSDKLNHFDVCEILDNSRGAR